MANFKLTSDQQKVLDSGSSELLVSASAGSGKTATLIEKIFDLIYNKHIDVDNLLVITFTEAASSEMKQRLKIKLFENAQDSFVKSQVEKVSTSDVSTIHAMCSKMLRKYFYKLDINPNFCILDENNSKFLKANSIEKVIDFYAEANDEKFAFLSSIFGGGRNFAGLQSAIISYNDFLCAVENRDIYKQQIFDRCYNLDLTNNEACKFLNNYILSSFYYYTQTLKTFLEESKIQNADYFEDFINQILVCVSGVDYKKSFMQNHKAVFEIELPKMSQKKMDEPNKMFKENFKPFYDLMKKQIADVKLKIIGKSEQQLIEDLKTAKEFVKKFNEVEQRFSEIYSNLKQKRNALDFADLEKYFLKLLEDEEVKQTIATQYKYIFVDEYQDINSTQEQILKKLILNNTIVMVGDIKQSIYGFRNSSPAIFAQKSAKYSQDQSFGQLINLNENFRSNPKILYFVNEIFKHIMSSDFGGVDYIKDSMLVGKTEYKENDNLTNIEMFLINKKTTDEEEIQEKHDKVYSVLGDKNKYSKALSNARIQGMVVAQKILNMLNQDIYDASKKAFRKISFSDIAVLSRGNEFLKEIAKVLAEYKIPLSTLKSENIYKNKDICMILSILKVVNNMHDDVSLVTALSSFIFDFSFDDLNTIKSSFDCEYFYQCFEGFAKTQMAGELAQKVNKFNIEINKIRFMLSNYSSIYDVLIYLQNKYDFLNYFKSLPGGANRYNVVKDFVDSFADAEYNYDLNKYLSYVKNFAEDNKFTSKIESSANSVKLSTIHISKGLEYPIVFLVNCDKDFSNITFRSELLKDKEYGLGVATYNLKTFEKTQNLASNAIALNLKKQEKAEELRLLYVALTRAKNYLTIVGQVNLQTITKSLNPFDASRAESFMPWVLSAITDTSFNCFLKQGKSFTDKHDLFDIKVNVLDKNDFVVEKQNQINLDILNAFSGRENDLKKYIDFELKQSNNIALKNTVSSMLQEYADSQVSINFEPKKLTMFEHKTEEIDAAKLGTAYHNIMQKIDFKNK
ncbi:MAG: UvrD-helicase domain-containing protein, partial [Clostridia bacterium]|nr:UvrD-helicase domain-containing protein [Clostridia bacterium]